MTSGKPSGIFLYSLPHSVIFSPTTKYFLESFHFAKMTPLKKLREKVSCSNTVMTCQIHAVAVLWNFEAKRYKINLWMLSLLRSYQSFNHLKYEKRMKIVEKLGHARVKTKQKNEIKLRSSWAKVIWNWGKCVKAESKVNWKWA